MALSNRKWVAEPSKAAGSKPQRAIKNGWSYSRYSVYHQCPAKAAYKFIDKLPEPPADALDRGTLIHKQAECFIKGQRAPMFTEGGPYPRLGKQGELPEGVKLYPLSTMPPALSKFPTLFLEQREMFKKRSVVQVTDDSWGFTRQWEPCSSTDWDRCWLRVKVDRGWEGKNGVFYIKDWKTGKYNEQLHEEYLETLQLYALATMLQHKHIRQVRPSLVYLDIGMEYPTVEQGVLEYARLDLPKLKKLWEGRVAPMFNDHLFAPRPNDKCRWCSFSKAKGGPCTF